MSHNNHCQLLEQGPPPPTQPERWLHSVCCPQHSATCRTRSTPHRISWAHSTPCTICGRIYPQECNTAAATQHSTSCAQPLLPHRSVKHMRVPQGQIGHVVCGATRWPQVVARSVRHVPLTALSGAVCWPALFCWGWQVGYMCQCRHSPACGGTPGRTACCLPHNMYTKRSGKAGTAK
jgi:hypothetical protein